MDYSNADLIECFRCGYRGPVLQQHMGYRWYYFLLVLTGIGAIPLALILWYLGNRTEPRCPQCGMNGPFQPSWADTSAGALATWRNAVAEDAQRFQRNRRITLAVVMAAAAMAVSVALLLAAGLA